MEVTEIIIELKNDQKQPQGNFLRGLLIFPCIPSNQNRSIPTEKIIIHKI